MSSSRSFRFRQESDAKSNALAEDLTNYKLTEICIVLQDVPSKYLLHLSDLSALFIIFLLHLVSFNILENIYITSSQFRRDASPICLKLKVQYLQSRYFWTCFAVCIRPTSSSRIFSILSWVRNFVDKFSETDTPILFQPKI